MPESPGHPGAELGEAFCRGCVFPFIVNLCNRICSKLSQRPNSSCAGGLSRVNGEKEGNATSVIAHAVELSGGESEIVNSSSRSKILPHQ